MPSECRLSEISPRKFFTFCCPLDDHLGDDNFGGRYWTRDNEEFEHECTRICAVLDPIQMITYGGKRCKIIEVEGRRKRPNKGTIQDNAAVVRTVALFFVGPTVIHLALAPSTFAVP